MKALKKIAIMQPTYLPWIGYFDLMDQVDDFVFLDSVQFAKRSWQQRNKIKTAKGDQWLTVPVLSKNRYKQTINQVRINTLIDFPKSHLKAIEYNYSRTKFFNKYYPFLIKILEKKHLYLNKLNIELILWFKKVLGIKTPVKRSSQLKVQGKKAGLLINICKKLKADCYLSPAGAKTYIRSGKIFKKNNIALSYHQYMHPKYNQLYNKFIPYLSIIDLLFNEGEKSLEIIKLGRIYEEQ